MSEHPSPHADSLPRLDELRGELARTRAGIARLEAETAAAGSERGRLPTVGGRARIPAPADAEARLAELARLRGVERTLRDRVRVATDHAFPIGPGRPYDPAAQMSGDLPIVLLPVRLETRFVPSRRELWVRIYPDEIVADSHEPPLLPRERDAGYAYWRSAWDPTGEPEAWRSLILSFPAPRAAWIVRATTPVNIANRPAGQPTLPDVALRESSWSRAVEARVLPERWVVRLFRDGALQHEVVTSVVPDPLILSLNPTTEPADEIALPDEGPGLNIDSDLAWTVDFPQAVSHGMGVVVSGLTDEDLSRGFDRVLVAGVKQALDPQATQERLSSLLDAHHYERGLAFVRQGTPTNNSAESGSGYPPPDPNGTVSYTVEREAPLIRDGSDGERFAKALGVESEVFAHVAGAGGSEQESARAMNTALFPCTLGYFLQQMMAPAFSDDTLGKARDLFFESVRGRGPLPAFRVGSVPYGMLPVGSLERWGPGDFRAGEEPWMVTLRKLRDHWMTQVNTVPRVGRTQDPDRDLVETLAMDASAREVWIRRAFGPDFRRNLLGLLGSNWEPWFAFHAQLAMEIGEITGHPEWRPLLIQMTYDDRSYRDTSPVVAEILSEMSPLDFNYIHWIRTASVDDLRDQRLPDNVPAPSALLYRLLRHAALTTYAQAAMGLHVRAGTASTADLQERELVQVSDDQAQAPTIWDRFDAVLPTITGNLTVADYLNTPGGDAVLEDLATFRAALEILEGLPTAELDRLTTETLDTCSHRLDAWITAVFSRRLESLREARATGSYLGGYGWVEGLKPVPAPPVPPGRRGPRVGIRGAVLSAGASAGAPPETGGYIHAPSMAHAATAAILRNAYLSRSGTDRSRYAVDLSSARVRDALSLLDGVREGQPLGAVLGYRFERGLHEGHPELELDKYIDPFRQLYPIVANKITDSGGPAEQVAARNVVDGLALRTAWGDGTIPFGQGDLPASGADFTAIQTELGKLDAVIDSVTDLLTAESVYQLARGNAAASAAALDSLARATRPPEPAIAAQPSGGTTFTQRLAVLIGGDPPAAPRWASIGATPRSRIEPYCDGWVAGLLGDPGSVKCSVRYRTAANPSAPVDGEIRLAELGLRPLDILALARQPMAPAAQGSELDLRIRDAVGAKAGEELAAVEITYVPAGDFPSRGFPELLELARAINELLGAARALAPEDLVVPERASSVTDSSRLPDEAKGRADAAANLLDGVRNELRAAVDGISATAPSSSPDLTALRASLRNAGLFGLAGAFPGSRFGSNPAMRAELLERGRSALGELEDRAKRAATGTPVERARAVFGRDFPWFPRFTPPDPDAISGALAESSSLGADARTLSRWLEQVAPVRAPAARWREVAILARASADARLPLEPAQLPGGTGRPWVGLPFGTEENRPPGGYLSIVWHRAQRPAADAPWVGLLIDEWAEVIPGRTEQTAVAFHYDDPGAEAAQTVLVAVAPPTAANWSLDLLFATLSETFDLAKLRAVDAESLGPLSQLLPGIYLAANPKRQTVATDFTSSLVGATRIAQT